MQWWSRADTATCMLQGSFGLQWPPQSPCPGEGSPGVDSNLCQQYCWNKSTWLCEGRLRQGRRLEFAGRHCHWSCSLLVLIHSPPHAPVGSHSALLSPPCLPPMILSGATEVWSCAELAAWCFRQQPAHALWLVALCNPTSTPGMLVSKVLQ